MRKKNGFSLVEILAIIIIIGIISGIAIWGIQSTIDKEEEATNDTLNTKIENAAHLYAAKYYASDIINCTSGPCKKGGNDIEFSLISLAEDGLLKLSDDECSDKRDQKIKISFETIDGIDCVKYNYFSLYDDSNKDCFNCTSVNDCKRP